MPSSSLISRPVAAFGALFLLLCAPLTEVAAQGQPAPPEGGEAGYEVTMASDDNRIPFWQCVLPSGSFTIALKEISSVSKHTYVVDGIAKVTEMNVGTSGSLIARFYYLEPITENSSLATVQIAQNRARDIAKTANNRATGSGAPWDNVVKNYPTTTHSHTVEYRVPDESMINTLFEDAEKAWITGKGSKIKLSKE